MSCATLPTPSRPPAARDSLNQIEVQSAATQPVGGPEPDNPHSFLAKHCSQGSSGAIRGVREYSPIRTMVEEEEEED